MARVYTLTDSNEDIKRALTRSLQSAHINYLIGAGASCPAVPVAGSVEQEIAALYESNQIEEGRAPRRPPNFPHLWPLETPPPLI